jgi:hypothetical protein
MWLFEPIWKPEQGSGRGLLEVFSQLVSDFIEARKNFILDVLTKETVKNIIAHTQSTD